MTSLAILLSLIVLFTALSAAVMVLMYAQVRSNNKRLTDHDEVIEPMHSMQRFRHMSVSAKPTNGQHNYAK